MLTIKSDDKYFYLSLQDVRYIQLSGSKENTEVIFKDGCTLIILKTKPKDIDRLLKSIAYENITATARLAAPEFRRKNLIGV